MLNANASAQSDLGLRCLYAELLDAIECFKGEQELRFHCPVYGILNFSKPKSKSYQRQTWSYDQGNYNVLRQKASSTDWDTLRDPKVNIHAQNITNHIMSLANECIPNRMTRIRQREPQWLTTSIKLYI